MRFLRRQRRSKDYAKDRLKTVLLSERIDCSSQMMLMMKNDVIQAVQKYLPVDGEQVALRYAADDRLVEMRFPLLDGLHSNTESENRL